MTPRNWLIRLLSIVALLVPLLVLSLPGTVSHVIADEIYEGYYWRMHFDFNGTYDGNLMVQYRDVKGNISSTHHNIPCIPVGSVDLTHNEAQFDGYSYLECTVPSIRDALIDLTRQDPIFLNGGEAYCPFILEAHITLNSVGTHAIVTHLAPTEPDVRFLVTYETSYGGNPSTYSQFAEFVNATIPSSLLPTSGPKMSGEPHDLQVMLSGPENSCTFSHMGLPSTNPVPISGVTFSPDATYIFIGHDPKTGSFLNGQIDVLDIDPGNFIPVH